MSFGHGDSLLCLLFALVAASGLWFTAAASGQAPTEQNLIRNGDFKEGVDEKGQPLGWSYAGDKSVDQTLSLDNDPEHGPCAKLVCKSITGGGPASHAMIAQYKSVELKAGKWYMLSFWARQEGIKGGGISFNVSQTKPWGSTGVDGGFRAKKEWKHFDFYCRSDKNVPADLTRFQIWHHSIGTLWLAEVKFVMTDSPKQAYAPLLETEGRKNLIPNSSFECGKSGWGSITQLKGWGGNLDQLFGEIDESPASHGKRSLKITLNEKTVPVFFFDYFELYREPAWMPLAANMGWIPVEQGRDYTLSAYLKADRPGVPAVLAIFTPGSQFHKIELTPEWQRYSFTWKARTKQCFVALGPDLREAPMKEATVWIDGVQFEQGQTPTDYEPSDPIEVGVEAGPSSHIFSEGQPVEMVATAYNNGDAEATAKLSVKFEDFFDAAAGEKAATVSVAPKSAATTRIETGLVKKGFYRAFIRTEAAGRVRETKMRLAIIAPYKEMDSLFGMNHAYPWDFLLKQVHDAGVLWMRDWSLKWQFVEPEKGKFTFAETDYQINRPMSVGEKMDLLLPFPSSEWSSTAPADLKPEKGYPSNRERMAFMPRDLEEFGNYVTACVNHYKDRTKYWEILNEPLYTSYALPPGHGYTGKDYVALLKTAYLAAKKADPTCFVIGGIASSGGKHYEDIIQAGCLDYMDFLNVHTYPGLTPPEASEVWLQNLNDMMRAAGKPRPIWNTEYAYYANDDISIKPYRFESPLVETEKLCAAYFVRINTIMLSQNVVRFFLHAGTCHPINQEGAGGIFFNYGGAPRKFYPVQSAMANLFPPGTKFVEKLGTPEGLRAYLFERSSGPILVAWAEEDIKGELSLTDPRLKALDIQGNALADRSLALTEYPVYVQGAELSASQVKGGLKITAKQ